MPALASRPNIVRDFQYVGNDGLYLYNQGETILVFAHEDDRFNPYSSRGVAQITKDPENFIHKAISDNGLIEINYQRDGLNFTFKEGKKCDYPSLEPMTQSTNSENNFEIT